MKPFYSLIIFFVLIFKANISLSQSGMLDASFGNSGKVVTATGLSNSSARAITITPNGKILVGGNEVDSTHGFVLDEGNLIQYNSDGTLDFAFGINGKVSPLTMAQTTIYSIAIQADNKIVVSGDGGNITRYNQNGNVDTTFGNHGYVKTAFTDGYIFVKKIIIKPDGKILVCGTVPTAIFEESYPAFAQYLPNGSLDSTFGTNGVVEKKLSWVPGTGKVNGINDITITPSGKIVAVMNVLPLGFDRVDFLLYQFLSNGNDDSTFGINGVMQTDVDSSSGDEAFSILSLPDNSLIVCGDSYKETTRVVLVKYKSNGFIDSSFGINGKVLTLPPNSQLAIADHIFLLSDSNLLVSGYAAYSKTDFLLAKYQLDGTLDSTFGTNGITTTDFSETYDFTYSSALQPDGKIVLVGSTGSTTDFDIALARYNNDIVYPVRLLSFTAVKNGSTNLLQWQVTKDVNTSRFGIERSANGKNYNTISMMNIAGSSYQFTDNKPLTGNNYYRLKTIDNDGEFTYSPIRMVNNTSSFVATIYPDPVKDELQLRIDNIKETILKWYITSVDGYIVSTGQCSTTSGTSVTRVPVASLQKGIYFITAVTKEKEKIVVKFQKL